MGIDSTALAILPDGSRDILGMWTEQTEGATFGMKFSPTRKHRSQSIPDCGHRGPKTTSEGVAASYPATTVANALDAFAWAVGAWRSLL